MHQSPIIFLFLALLLSACGGPSEQTAATEELATAPLTGWDLAKAIEDSIVAPTFPDQNFSVTDYGATTDPGSNNREAFARAIQACHEAGGGRVVVPPGVYHSGPIHLLENVNFHLEKGAEIRFSTNPADFLPLVHTSFEGIELMNYSPAIYAYGQKNVALTGQGLLNGQASNAHWWWWCGKDTYGWKEGKPQQKDESSRPRLVELAAEGVPVAERQFGADYYLRPTFVEFFECENVLIQGVKLVNTPFWVMHPIKSVNVTVDGVTVESHGPNNDGCNPEYSRNVLIKNCHFDTGDDCIAIKAGRNEDGRRVAIPSENIIVRDCKMLDGHGGVVMGSEMSAGVRNVFVENCSMDSPNLDRAIRIKTNTKRGGFVENVYVRNIEVGQVKEAVLKVNLFYGVYSNQEGGFIPRVSNINLENVRVKNGGYFGILAKGRENSPITDITFRNVVIEKVDEPFSLEHVIGLRLIDTYINGELMQSPVEE